MLEAFIKSLGEISETKMKEISEIPKFFDELKDFDADPDTPVARIENTEGKETCYYTSYEERINHTPKEDSELGFWEGARGESKFVPNETIEPGSGAKGKLSEYGMDGVEYESAEPDFSKCCEAEVKIDKMTENRENYVDKNGGYQQGNFAQADAKCAEQWNSVNREGKDDWTASDVRDWRRENKYSWHECCDTSTMQLVSREIHSTFKHSGGVAECKIRDYSNDGGGFDE